jgi:MerR family transcriptional regulator, copper efflux regulator
MFWKASPSLPRPELSVTKSLHRHLAIVQGAQPLPSARSEQAAQHLQGAQLDPDPEQASRLAAPCEEAELLQVGDLAKQTKKTVRAIHLYEDMGLLTPVDRSRGRFRLYNHDSIERVRWISKMQAVGFSLPELRELLEKQQQAPSAKQAALALRGAYVGKLSAVQEKLAELHRLEQELLSSLTYLDACQSACIDEAHREDCPACARHVDQPAPPALVAGAHVG